MRRLEARISGRLLPPVHDGLAIAAFISVWFVPLVGLILGLVANRTARREGRRNSGLAVAAVVLGCLGVIVWVVIIAALASAAAKAGQPIPAVYPSA